MSKATCLHIYSEDLHCPHMHQCDFFEGGGNK